MSPLSLDLPRLEYILEVTHNLSVTASLEQLLHKITQAAAELTDTEIAGILLLDEPSGELRFMTATYLVERMVCIPVPIDSSIAGAAFTSRAPVIVPDVNEDPRYYRIAEAASDVEAHSLLAVPLQFQERCLGVLEVENKRNELPFSPQDTETLLVLAAQAASAIFTARLYEQAQRRAEQLTTINEFGWAVSILQNKNRVVDVMDAIYRQVQLIVPVDGFFICLYDPQRGELAFPLVCDLGLRYQEPTISLSPDSSIAQVLRTGKPVRVLRTPEELRATVGDRLGDRMRTYASSLYMPLRSSASAFGVQVMGVLSVHSYTVNAYTAEHAEFLTGIETQIAIAIRNAQLYEQAQQEIVERTRAEAEVRRHRDHLEELVDERLAEIKQINAELQQQNAELDAFAHTVAHDLKNPLGAMMGFAQILLEELHDTPNEVAQDCSTHLLDVSHKMARIIDELLLLASVRRQDEVRLEELDMAAIVHETQERVDYLAQQYGAEISLPLSWPAAVGHAAWIEEVWTNYLSNAIKFGGRPPYIELGATVLENNDMVRFWVRDNGAGLAPEDQARLFTEFTQVHQLRAQGHGLGLSIVRRIVERLGGQVGVESAPDHGSVFFFTLPLATTESSITITKAMP